VKRSIQSLLFKIVLMCFIVVSALYPFAYVIHQYQIKNEPKRAVLNRMTTEGFQYALLGSSVFLSNYYTNEEDAIWKRFEFYSGEKCYPGALIGARKDDLIQMAVLMVRHLPPRAMVFISISPTDFTVYERKTDAAYKKELMELRHELTCFVCRVFNYMNVEYLHYAIQYLKKTFGGANHTAHSDEAEDDLAYTRYKQFIKTKLKKPSKEQMEYLKDLQSVFSQKGVRSVFVLMPFNRSLIHAFSDDDEAATVEQGLDGIRNEVDMYLKAIQAEVINLDGKIPEDGLSDLEHTNIKGDDYVARALAEYAIKAK